MLFMVPLKRRSLSGGMGYVESKCLFTKFVSMKQLEEPESTNMEKAGMVSETKVTEGIRDLGSEKADVSQISLGAQVGATQPPSCAESWRSLHIFLTL